MLWSPWFQVQGLKNIFFQHCEINQFSPVGISLGFPFTHLWPSEVLFCSQPWEEY